MMRQPTYQDSPHAPSQRADRGIRRNLRQAQTSLAHVGSVGSGLFLVDTVLHTWDSSYNVGGESIDVPVVGAGTVYGEAAAKAGYTFDVNEASGLILAYTAVGTEVAGGTDLSSVLGTVPVHFYGVGDSERTAYASSGLTFVQGVRFRLGETVDTDPSTSYWTFTLFLVRERDGRKEELATFDSYEFTLTKRTWFDLWAPQRGEPLADGDTLVVEFTPGGTSATPPVLEDVVFETRYYRRAI